MRYNPGIESRSSTCIPHYFSFCPSPSSFGLCPRPPKKCLQFDRAKENKAKSRPFTCKILANAHNPKGFGFSPEPFYFPVDKNPPPSPPRTDPVSKVWCNVQSGSIPQHKNGLDVASETATPRLRPPCFPPKTGRAFVAGFQSTK